MVVIISYSCHSLLCVLTAGVSSPYLLSLSLPRCRFAVGYCLDYNEVYRDLPHIAVINQTGIDRFRDYEHGADGDKAEKKEG